MTHDICYVTCDMQHVTHGGRWSFSQNFRSLAHTVWEWRCLEDISTKDQLLNHLMSDKGVCRTALATPGLLNIEQKKEVYWCPSICVSIYLVSAPQQSQHCLHCVTTTFIGSKVSGLAFKSRNGKSLNNGMEIIFICNYSNLQYVWYHKTLVIDHNFPVKVTSAKC